MEQKRKKNTINNLEIEACLWEGNNKPHDIMRNAHKSRLISSKSVACLKDIHYLNEAKNNSKGLSNLFQFSQKILNRKSSGLDFFSPPTSKSFYSDT